MAASDVAALSGIILKTAAAIQQLGENWYKASDEWKAFPQQVDGLRRDCEFWTDKLTKYGLSSDKDLKGLLSEAKLLLEEEEAKLSRRTAKGTSCWTGYKLRHKLSKTVFPAQLGLSIQRVNDAFDAIRKDLQREQDVEETLKKRALGRPLSLPFRRDDRYVPLKVTQSAVFSALENSHGPSVVLLHGGSGRGKSTLARYTALHYKDQAIFDLVIFLECGPKADISTKQFDLLQRLGSDVAAPKEDGRPDSNITIPKQLRGLLKERKILIIFDDVWEDLFLQKMVDVCGSGVKILVTSQLRHLCRGLNCLLRDIAIEDIQPDDATKILASHVGFTDKCIPTHLQALADKMIKEAMANPLALACIATAINYERANEEEEWEEASADFFQLLQAEDTAFILSEKYPRSFWSAMRLSINSLKEDAQQLLLLTHICDGPSVPEEVIQFLFRSAKVFLKCSATFEKLRNELESRELIKITSEEVIFNTSTKERSWSIHSLQKRFIQKETKMRDLKESILNYFLGLLTEPNVESSAAVANLFEVKDSVVIALCALYCDEKVAQRAASKMGIPFDSSKSQRRSAIEPITRLLGKRMLSECSTEATQACARQVFLRYICDGVLDDNGVSNLLGLQIYATAMLRALNNVVLLQEEPLLGENTQGLLKALVELLRESQINGNPHVQCEVARVLANLASGHEHGMCQIIVNTPRSIEELVNCLSKDNHLDLQHNAIGALANLALSDTESGQKIVDTPRALEELVRFLSMDNNPKIQCNAAQALTNIAVSFGNNACHKIVNTVGALEMLVRCLSKDDNPELQQAAIEALLYVAINCDYGETYKQIINAFGVLEELLECLFKDSSSELQYYAARTLSVIASGPNKKMHTKCLVDLDKVSNLQAHGQLSLSHLCTLKAKLGCFQGALADANKAVEIDGDSLFLQERGVLKRMMGDLPEALSDLNKALCLETDDYETLKHRGYVKFLMGDEHGARADAEWALRVIHSGVDKPGYQYNCLGTSPVEYLEYKLR